jgi:hypothetical protein
MMTSVGTVGGTIGLGTITIDEWLGTVITIDDGADVGT